MTMLEWPQYGITCTHRHTVDQVAELLNLEMATLVADGAVTCWWFIRKPPGLRLRYQPADQWARRRLERLLDALIAQQQISGWTPGIYEPEIHAFGGLEGMDVSHILFQHDSRNLLDYLTRARQRGTPELGRRELAMLLISTLLRSAGLDWFEQGDVWARVAAERAYTADVACSERIKRAVHRLMTTDVGSASSLVSGGPLASLDDWITGFGRAGQQLAELNRRGVLERGLRAVLAHHVIFHWNRLGLSVTDQRTLSTLAKQVVMGTRDGAASAPKTDTTSTSLSEVSTQMIDDTRTAENLRNKLADQLREQGTVTADAVDAAVRTVPRDVFVRQFKPDASLEESYADRPVHTKFDADGVSISAVSQPSVNSLMLELTDARPGMRILEAGAGSGLFASYLGHLVGEGGHVTTLDVDQDLVNGARAAIEKARVSNVTVILRDGAVGYSEGAPYDRIVATVGAHGVPQPWLDQLVPDGRLVVPVRLRGSVSRAVAFERDIDGRWRSIGSKMCTFMPLRAGVADDPRRIVAVTDDGGVKLQFNRDQTADEAALRGVLEEAGHEAWSGVKFRGPESPEFMWLYLSCALDNGLSRMEVDRQSVGARHLSDGFRPMAAADQGSLAYLTLRKADMAPDGGQLYEAGAIGHGPAGKELANRVAEEMVTWDRDFRHRGVAFEIRALNSAPLGVKPGRFAFDNPISRIVIEWQ